MFKPAKERPRLDWFMMLMLVLAVWWNIIAIYGHYKLFVDFVKPIIIPFIISLGFEMPLLVFALLVLIMAVSHLWPKRI